MKREWAKKMLFVRDKGFYRGFLALCLPIAAQSLINIGINMLDTVMLGALGDTPLSASSLMSQFFFLYLILHFGISGGVGVLTAQYWGKNDLSSIQKALALGTQLSVALSLLFFALSLACPEWIMERFTNEPEVVAQGAIYARYLAPVYLTTGIVTVVLSVLRSVGTVKIALYTQISSLLINLVFNYLLIYGKFGFPRLEIAGAAIATVIARVVEAAILFFYMTWRENKILFRLRHLLSFSPVIFKAYIAAGIAVLISDALLGVGNSALAMVMGRMGQSMVAGNSIAGVVMQLATVLASGFGAAGAVLTGNAVGAGEYKRAKDEGITMTMISIIFGIVAAGLILLLRGPMIAFYSNVTEETKQIAWQLMNVQAGLVVFSLAGSVLTKGVLRGGGDTRFLMVADVLFLWVLAVPLGALAGLYWHLPPWVTFLFLRLDEIVKFIWCAFRIRGDRWIKNVTI